MLRSYVFHTLTVTGNRRELDEFRSFADGFDPCLNSELHLGENFNLMCFNNFLPIRTSYASIFKLEADRKAIWGCESNAISTSLKESPGKLIYRFVTFDFVPREVIRSMVRRFPNLAFNLQYENDRKGWEGAMKVYKDKIGFVQTDKFK